MGDPYEEGYQAGLTGDEDAPNPYPVKPGPQPSLHRERWHKGWSAGLDEWEKAQEEKEAKPKTQCFQEQSSGKMLLCFYDKRGDWHIEYLRDLRTKDLISDQPKDHQFFINDCEVTPEQFRMMLQTLDKFVGGDVFPITDLFPEEGT